MIDEMKPVKLDWFSFFSVAFILVLITIIMVYEICLELIFSGDQNPPPIPKF